MSTLFENKTTNIMSKKSPTLIFYLFIEIMILVSKKDEYIDKHCGLIHSNNNTVPVLYRIFFLKFSYFPHFFESNLFAHKNTLK